MYKQAQTAGTNPELEKSKLLSQGDCGKLGRRRPADTLLNMGAGVVTGKKRNRMKIALDVGVVNPQAACHVSEAAEAELGAATAYTQKKREYNDTDSLCDAVGIDYQPIVWESFGGLCKKG